MGTRIRFKNKKKKLDSLTDQQRVFVEALFADREFNYTNAAREAGYALPSKAATKLIENPVIQQALAARIRSIIKPMQLTAKELDQVLTDAVRLDPLDIYEPGENGLLQVKDLRSIPPEVRKLISTIKTRTRYNQDGSRTVSHDLVLFNKEHAAELMMKRLGMLDNRLKIDHGINPEAIALFQQMYDQVNGSRNVVGDEEIAKSLEYIDVESKSA